MGVGWFCVLTLVLGTCGLFLCVDSSSCTRTVHAFLHKLITPVLLNMWPVMGQGLDQDRNQGTASSTAGLAMKTVCVVSPLIYKLCSFADLQQTGS